MVFFVVSFLGCVVGLLGWLSLIDLGVSSTRVSFPPDDAKTSALARTCPVVLG